MIYLAALALAVGFGLPVAVLGAATAQGKAIAQGLESMARQPELAAALQTAMLIGLAFIELFILLTFVIAFMVQGKMPIVSADQILDIARSENPVVRTVDAQGSGLQEGVQP